MRKTSRKHTTQIATLDIPANLVGFLVSDGDAIRPVPLQIGQPLNDQLALSSPEAVYALCQDMATLRKEYVRALFLDSRQRLIRQETVSVGTLTASLVHPREVFQPAVECSACSLILVHNHPSGDPTPSPDDRILTRRLTQAGEILGIELVDHIIVGRHGYISLRERGAF